MVIAVTSMRTLSIGWYTVNVICRNVNDVGTCARVVIKCRDDILSDIRTAYNIGSHSSLHTIPTNTPSVWCMHLALEKMHGYLQESLKVIRFLTRTPQPKTLRNHKKNTNNRLFPPFKLSLSARATSPPKKSVQIYASWTQLAYVSCVARSCESEAMHGRTGNQKTYVISDAEA